MKEIDGKGNIVMVTGVPGTSTDTILYESAMKVFNRDPDIKIIATVNGMWSQATARAELVEGDRHSPLERDQRYLGPGGLHGISHDAGRSRYRR